MSVLYLFLLLAGIAFLFMGFAGRADNLIAALTGKQYRHSTLK